MGSRSFNIEFLKHYSISGFFKDSIKGGQKSVHFIIRNDEQQVLKIFDGGKDARFDREMKIYDRYKDIDGIPKIYSVQEYEGETLVFEQFVEGNTLEDVYKEYHNDGQKVKSLLKNLFDILIPIWKDGYVHRDIKPANIIIRKDGTAVVLDFGIARDLGEESITVTGPQPGTWKWAAPEQYAGQKDMISYRTDFFSLGVLGYYLFHNILPFGKTIEEIAAKFKADDESFEMDGACPVAEFFTEAMKFKPSYRPRDIADLYKLI